MNRPHVKLLIIITAVLSGGSEGKQLTPSVHLNPLEKGQVFPATPRLRTMFASSQTPLVVSGQI